MGSRVGSNSENVVSISMRGACGKMVAFVMFGGQIDALIGEFSKKCHACCPFGVGG